MLFFWRKARNQHDSGAGQQAVPDDPVVLEIEALELPARDDTLIEWVPPSAIRQADIPDHIRVVIEGLQDCGRTGYVPGMVIHRVYPELAWMAGVEPLTRRQLDLALSAHLPKTKRRGPEGALLAHYLIPEKTSPKAAPKNEHKQSNVVAYASKPKFGTQQPKSHNLSLKPQKVALKPHRRAKGTARAAA